MYVHDVRAVAPDCRSCPAIGFLVPQHCFGLTPKLQADQVPVIKDQWPNIMPMVVEKISLGRKAGVLPSRLLIMGMQDEDSHHDARKEFVLVETLAAIGPMG